MHIKTLNKIRFFTLVFLLAGLVFLAWFPQSRNMLDTHQERFENRMERQKDRLERLEARNGGIMTSLQKRKTKRKIRRTDRELQRIRLYRVRKR